MSYGMTAALQSAVYGRLSADVGLAVLRRSAVGAGGALHEFSVSVVTTGAGFHLAKEAAAAVSDAVLAAPLTLSRGRASRVHFTRAKAVRTSANRRIDIWFRARLDEAVA